MNKNIYYQIKLIDDLDNLEEKLSPILKTHQEYNRKTSNFANIKFDVNSKPERKKYIDSTFEYIKKLDDLNGKTKTFIKEVGEYRIYGTSNNYKVLKRLQKEIQPFFIDPPKYNRYIQQLKKRSSTENDEDMRELEGEIHQLSYEFKTVKYIVDDIMETIDSIENQDVYVGIDYKKRYDYAKSMVDILNDEIKEKEKLLTLSSISDEEILIKADIAYFENKKANYLKTINNFESVVDKEADKNIYSKFAHSDIKGVNLLDILTNSVTEFRTEEQSLTQVGEKEMQEALTSLFSPQKNQIA